MSGLFVFVKSGPVSLFVPPCDMNTLATNDTKSVVDMFIPFPPLNIDDCNRDMYHDLEPWLCIRGDVEPIFGSNPSETSLLERILEIKL